MAFARAFHWREFFAGREARGILPNQSIQYFRVRQTGMFDAETNIIGYPGRVIEQVSNIDLLSIRWKFRKIFRKWIVIGKLMLFDKHHDGHRRELFCKRCQVHLRVRSKDKIVFDVCFAKSTFVDNASPFSD